MNDREYWAALRSLITESTNANGLKLRALFRRDMETFWVAGVIRNDGAFKSDFGVGYTALEAFTDLANELGLLEQGVAHAA